MEFVQTVLVQIDASKIDAVSRPLGLLAGVDAHISYLQQQRGFLDMRVTRSINAEGNVLLVVETRWQDDTSLMDYETREPDVMSILSKHKDIIVPDSLQVLDMEAIRTEAGQARAAAEASERLRPRRGRRGRTGGRSRGTRCLAHRRRIPSERRRGRGPHRDDGRQLFRVSG